MLSHEHRHTNKNKQTLSPYLSVGHAKNKAISQSCGKYLCFQDAVSVCVHVRTCFIYCSDVFHNIYSGESKPIRSHVQYIIHSHRDLRISVSVWQRCQGSWPMTWEQCLTCVCLMCMFVHELQLCLCPHSPSKFLVWILKMTFAMTSKYL